MVLLIAGRTCKMRSNTTHVVIFFCSLIGRTQRKVRKDRILVYPCVASLAACDDPFTIVRNYICNATQRNAAQRLAEHCELGLKRQICGNIKKAFFLKLSYSKVRAVFTHLGRGSHL